MSDPTQCHDSREMTMSEEALTIGVPAYSVVAENKNPSEEVLFSSIGQCFFAGRTST
jgi:hypothetical protein